MFKSKMNIKNGMYVFSLSHSGMYILPSYFSFFTWDKSDMMVSGELRRWEDQSVARRVADGDRGMVAM